MKLALKISIFIVILSFVIAGMVYSFMPENIASHWDINGQINGNMPKFLGLFLVPILSVVFILIFILLPKIDPLKDNYKSFSNYYEGFILILILFLFYTYILTILLNLNFSFNLLIALTPAFAILFFYLGILMENSKQNWFVGIRTPWTMSDEKIWKKTHQLSGKILKVIGVIALAGIIFPQYFLWIILIPVVFWAVFSVLYSYILFKRNK